MSFLFEYSDSLNMPFECFVYDTSILPFPIKPHWHYFMEMIFILEGSAEMHAGEDVHILESDDLILFYPQTVHSIYPVNDKPLKYAVFKFDVNKLNGTLSYAPKMRNIIKNAAQKNMPVVFNKSDTDIMQCRSVFTECINENHNQKYGYDLIISSEINSLLMKIIRIWLSSGFSVDNSIFTEDMNYDIDSITEYIDHHMNENIQVSDIAAKCGLSYSCFAKKFRAFYGMSCKEYIELMRIFKVEEFLLFTDFDLNYISQETGFSDCSHMIKSFKKYKECTPKQFRIRKKNDN